MKKRTVNTYHNHLDPVEYPEKVKVQVSISKQMNVGTWYNPVTTEEELKITKMMKQKLSRQQPPWNCQWHMNGKNIKQIQIALLMRENLSYKPLFIDLKKSIMMGKDKYPTSL